MQKRRTAQLSLFQTLTTLPAIFAPLLGGYLVHSMGTIEGFRAGIILSLAISPISTLLLVRFLRENTPVPSHHQAAEEACAGKITAGSILRPKHLLDRVSRLPRPLIPVLSAYGLVIAANSMTSPYMIFYATSIAKLDSLQWGMIMSLQLFFASMIRTPLGIVSDRFDKRKVLFMSATATAPLATLLVLVHSFIGILGILLTMIATGITYGPTHESLQIDLATSYRRPAMIATHYILKSTSASIGTVVGGMLFMINYPLVFYGFSILEGFAAAIIGMTFLGRVQGRNALASISATPSPFLGIVRRFCSGVKILEIFNRRQIDPAGFTQIPPP